jgi:hypothetical protein
MGNAINAPRAQTLAFQGAANRVMRGLLRMPLLCRVIGNWLMTSTSLAASPEGATRFRLPTPTTTTT